MYVKQFASEEWREARFSVFTLFTVQHYTSIVYGITGHLFCLFFSQVIV